MVSQDSPPNSASSMLHQFIISDSMASTQDQFNSQGFSHYGSDLRHHGAIPHSLGGVEISHTRHLMDLLGAAANETDHQPQRLSLSLGSHLLLPQVQYRQRSFNSGDFVTPGYLIPEDGSNAASNQGLEHMHESSFMGTRSSISYGTESVVNTIGNSRYLRPMQELLEEIVSVSCKEVDISNEKFVDKWFYGSPNTALGLSSELKAELCSNQMIGAEKQEFQVKMAKLIALLEEVDNKYKKYYHQLQEVVSSFEEITGVGSGKTYTALALQAMSRHFYNLRDAIISQINIVRRKISHDLPKISKGLSGLSLFDRDSEHARMSLQQLGLIQTQRQAWRPIRGLPETSVAILRAWLFEHFLHPYPNDSEKLMLASQTGLSKNQVSNWFINARVRLWKPMIEEMYKEEFAESSDDQNQLAGSNEMSRGDAVSDKSDD